MVRHAEIQPGMEVLCRDDHVIGHVKTVLPGGAFFQVDCRHAPDLYVPMSAVAGAREGAVHLRVTRAETTNLGWEAKPS
jgi:hypothetical protein